MRFLKKIFGGKDSSDDDAQTDAFLKAVENSDLIQISEMLQINRDLVSMQRFGYGHTPLQIAAEKGDTSIVTLLLAKGAEVNGKSFRGITPGQTPLCLATRKGHKEVARLLLAKRAKVNDHQWDEKTPLHNAAGLGDKSMVELLLSHKADVNARYINYNTSWTPLDCAAEAGHMDIVVLLRKHGGKAYSTDEIIDSEYKPSKKPFRVKESPDDIAAILEAASKGKVREVRNMLNEHPNLLFCSVGIYCGTPLQTAAFYGHTELVELLLAKGAEINTSIGGKAGSLGGATPLHYAAEGGKLEMVLLLLEKGAHINAKTRLGKTPLHHAVQSRSVEITELLIAKGADISATNYYGRTPLHEAINGKNSLELARVFIKNKAEINFRDKEGKTPLRLAQDGYTIQMGLENDPIYFIHRVNGDLVDLLLQNGGQ